MPLSEGHARWQGGKVPVHVPISLLAAEAQHVQPLRLDRLLDCPADAVDPPLQIEILRFRNIAHHAFDVCRRGHTSVYPRKVG